MLEGIKDGEYIYFVHSYHVEQKRNEFNLPTTDYGIDFVSSIEYENIIAVQFTQKKVKE